MENSEVINNEVAVKEPKTKKAKVKKDLKYYQENDKKYRGPLSILKMRIIGWALMAITAFSFGLSMFLKAKGITNLDELRDVLTIIGSLSLSAFMVASFSWILQNRTTMTRVLRTYGLGALAIAGGYYLIYFLYASNLLAHFQNKGYLYAVTTLDSFLTGVLGKGLNFNVFIDMAMFAILCFFLFYMPKMKFFKERLTLFRWLAVLPALYILGMFTWRTLFVFGIAPLPLWTYALLPSKSPLLFISFCVVALMVKLRERKFFKSGKTQEEYDVAFNSNGNSWIVAKDFAISLAIFGFIDLVITIVIVFFIVAFQASAQGCLDADGNIIAGMEELYENYVASAKVTYNFVSASKIGTAAGQIFFAPIVLLFSFNRKHTPSKWDILLPIIGIGVMAFVIFNWIFALLMSI